MENQIPPFNPFGNNTQIVPLDNTPKREYFYGGTNILQFASAFTILALIVLFLPSRYALWLPVIILLGYMVVNKDSKGFLVVENILKQIDVFISTKNPGISGKGFFAIPSP